MSQQYELLERIINDSTCVVYRGMNVHHMGIAVKLLDNEALGLYEAITLERFNHVNVIQLIDSSYFMCPISNTMKFGIVLPLFDKDLRSFMMADMVVMSEKIRNDVRVQIKLQTARAVEHVHGENIIHGDMKPENFLIEYHQDGIVHTVLADFGSAAGVDDSSRSPVQKVTPEYQAPEGRRTHNPVSSMYGDIYSLGRIFCELEAAGEMRDANQISKSIPVAFFSLLARDMVEYDFIRRPLIMDVLMRLGESTNLLYVEGDLCKSPVVNCMADKMGVFSNESYNKAIGHHRLVALLCSGNSDDVNAAYWLLHTVAIAEASDFNLPPRSVLSVLPYIHAHLGFALNAKFDSVNSATIIHKLMYCKAVMALCNRAYFILSNDAKLILHAFSAISVCKRAVLAVIAKTAAKRPALLEWCVQVKWGVFGECFKDFVMRFEHDWSDTARNAVCTLRLLLKT